MFETLDEVREEISDERIVEIINMFMKQRANAKIAQKRQKAMMRTALHLYKQAQRDPEKAIALGIASRVEVKA